eukprot:SAG31_NODE_422_length_15859_cov_5.161865_3_plen_463_part_00
MVTITENHDVHTDLTIEPGQVVLINGDKELPTPPTWGSGSFTISESASLSLSYLHIETVIMMDEGALALNLDNCVLAFEDTMVLHVTTSTFLHQRFRGGLVVPNRATVTIADSDLSFGVGPLDNQDHGLQTWSSGVVTNANGKTFTLYLLPLQPASTFSNDAAGARVYADLCAVAGLRPVTTGASFYYPTHTDCDAYNCMPIDKDNDDTSDTNDDTAPWVRSETGWSDFVVQYPDHGLRRDHDGAIRSDTWDFPLHPVCGCEHSSGLTVQSGAELTLMHTTLTTEVMGSTVLLVEEGGITTVEACQLERAEGTSDPMPCDGALLDCVAPHAGAVELAGVAVVRSDLPLICDAETGECINGSDMCFVVDCGVGGTCVSPHGTCTCSIGYSGDRCETHTCCSSDCCRDCVRDSRGVVEEGVACGLPLDCHYGYDRLDWCDSNHPGWDALVVHGPRPHTTCDRTC